MKYTKLILVSLILLIQFNTAAQTIGASQLKLKTNGGLSGDASNRLAVTPYRGASAPASPLTGQLWCDTNTTPCVLKIYNGSSWEISPGASTITIQADTSSFPATPSDGQVFISKSARRLYYYDSTAAKWYSTPFNFQVSGSSYNPSFATTVITAPSSVLTASHIGSGGSIGAGTYNYKYTYVNASGGETTPSDVSATMTASGGSSSGSLSGITTGGNGTTARRIYRCKTGTTAVGPWYWVGTISDNVTTVFTDTLADASLVLLAPDRNFSGDLPAGWSAVNTTASTTSGGCGLTATQSLVCKSSNTLNPSTTGTTDTYVRAFYDFSSVASDNFTIYWRITNVSAAGTQTNGTTKAHLGGVRLNTTDNAIKSSIYFNNTSSIFTTSNYADFYESTRTSQGGANTSVALIGPFLPTSQYPIYIKLVRKDTYLTYFMSSDNVNWVNTYGTTTDTPAGNSVYTYTTLYNRWELMVGYTNISDNYWVEMDSFSISVP